jgi:hypothetical protein
MPPGLRLPAAIMVGVAVYFFVYWVPFSLLGLLVPAEHWVLRTLALVVSAGAGIGAGRLVWRSAGSENRGIVMHVVRGALLVGGIGFTAGFFGPMILTPGANQGPLLGLLITGPLGFLLGALGGLVLGLSERRAGQRVR